MEVVVESSAESLERAYQTYQPIQWEQRRREVWGAMVAHRWAALKLRALSRQQAARDWSATVEKQVWEWSRRVGGWFFGDWA